MDNKEFLNNENKNYESNAGKENLSAQASSFENEKVFEENDFNAQNSVIDETPAENWHFSDVSSEADGAKKAADSPVIPVIKKPKHPNAKPILISVLLSFVITCFLCTATFGAFLLANRTKIGKNGSLVVFKDSDELRQNVDVSDSLSTLASDGKTPLTTQQIAQKVGPAVVGIVSTGEKSTGFFNMNQQYQASGSGIVISEDGYIVTNNHVIEGAKQITVILNTNDEYTAKLIGTDPKTDLAVLKIEATGLTYAALGSSGSVEVGESVVAIGNPLGMELMGTVTKGIISAKNRSIEVDGKTFVLLQTDAAINSGNSGGALVNVYGEVIGINSAKLAASGVEGLSFAIPSDVAKPIVEDLISSGYVKGRPVIGIIGTDISKTEAEQYGIQEGILVMGLSENSAAKQAGIQRGDLVIKCQGEDVKTIEELNAIRDKYKAGDQITLTIIRNDQTMDIMLTLGEETQQSSSSNQNSQNNQNNQNTLPY